MQFTAVLATFLPALAAAVAIPEPYPVPDAPLIDNPDVPPNSSVLCYADSRLGCAASTDGVQRCLRLMNLNLCVIDCEAQSVCNTKCDKLGFKRGFCTVGDFPCICTDSDAGSNHEDASN